jgi:hypothetical protein
VIISHRHKFIFLKTKKTGGTSIEIALSRLCGPEDVITRISPPDEELRQELGFPGPQNTALPADQVGLGARALAALRGRALEFYNHAPAEFVRRHVSPAVWDGYFKFSFERDPYDKAISRYYWSNRDRKELPPLTEYLEREREMQLSNWSIYAIGDRVATDFVGRYENLAEDLRTALRRVGITEAVELPRTKAGTRSDRRHYSELLDARARARIEKVCARELAAFGYRWQTPAAA